MTRSCDDCALGNRRAFLRDTFVALAGIAAALGITDTANAWAALPVGTARALHHAGNLHRYALPIGDGAQIDRENQVILVRWKNSAYAFNLSCPHQNTALKWDDGDHRFHCPKHHSVYEPDGEFVEGRATRGMDRMGIRRDGNNLVVDLDTLIQQDLNPAAWSAAVVHLV